MKITPRKKIEDYSLPLPIFSSICIADAIGRDGEEFNVLVGMDEKYTVQLKHFSLNEKDKDLQNNTGDKERFGKGSYQDWYDKNRTPFCLIHKQTDALAALVWFGPKPIGAKSAKFGPEEKYEIQDNWHTISFRSYAPFRGKGIMKGFSEFVIDVYKKQFPDVKFWVGTDVRNEVFIRLILGLGFEEDVEASDLRSNWLILVKK